jgi:hypothetical protein
MEHRHGGQIIAITGIGHDTFTGVASWFFIGDVKWRDGSESKQMQIAPNEICGTQHECSPLFEKLNAYLTHAGEWHKMKHKRDGRCYSWTPRERRGFRPIQTITTTAET